jgi:hypothetical protein
MNTEELKKLLEKYYEGKTSEAEEFTLREFISNNNIPVGYETEKEIFGFYSGLEKVPEPSPDFEEKIMTVLDKNISGLWSLKRRRLVLSLFNAAAVVLILTGSYFFFIHKSEPGDTFSDPELAYAETLKILYTVSSRLNKGTQTLKPLCKMNEAGSKSVEAINKSTIIIEENMKNMNYFRKAFEIISLSSKDSINK